MTKNMDLVVISIKMVQNMKANGSKINNTAKGGKPGLTSAIMMASSRRERSTGKGNSTTALGLPILETSQITASTVTGFILGPTGGYTQVSGMRAKCRVTEFTPGRMDVYMQESMLITRRKAMGYRHGQMGGSMTGNG